MSSESVVIQTQNGRALGVAVIGSILLVVAGIVLVLVAMPPVVRALLMVAWLALFALALAAWRSSRSRFAHDEIGLRRLDEYGWELPWGAIERMEIVRRMGQNHLVVEAGPGAWQPPGGLLSGLLGGLGATPAGAFTIPGVDELPPRPEQVAPVGQWFASPVVVRNDEIKGIIAAIGALGGIVGTVLAGEAYEMFVLVGLGFGAAAVYFLAGTRTLAVLDDHGIRRIGREHWRRDWAQIPSASVMLGQLLVGVAPVGVQDRHSSTGLAGQFARLGQAVQAPRVPVAKRDSEKVQAIIDQPRGWVA